jgi:hypothetical protein
MQSYSFIARAVLATAGLMFAGETQAALNYNDGDLLLAFRATGGTGSDKNIVVNLGSASAFTNLAPGGTFVLDTEIGNLKADLDFYFGASWQTRVDLLWSVSGVQKFLGNGFAGNTSFATNTQTGTVTLGLQKSAAWNRPATLFQSNPLSNSIKAFGDRFALGDGDASPIPGSTESTNGAGTLIQLASGSNSYSSYMPLGANSPGATAFGWFGGATGIEGNFGSGTAGTVLDLYEVGTGSGTGAFEGTFNIANNGTVTFTSAVPEPSSVAVLFAGTTVLGCLRRRKSNP